LAEQGFFADVEDDPSSEDETSMETEMEDLKKQLLTLRKERKKLESELESTMEEYFPPLSDGPGKAEAEAALNEGKKLYYERMGKWPFSRC
jgi:predicted RNase H-like nuclease (RuvC/YqgF family)